MTRETVAEMVGELDVYHVFEGTTVQEAMKRLAEEAAMCGAERFVIEAYGYDGAFEIALSSRVSRSSRCPRTVPDSRCPGTGGSQKRR